MKKFFLSFGLLLTVSLATVVFNSCAKDDEETENPDESGAIVITGISLDKTTLTLFVGESQTLTATVAPAYAPDQTVTWKSSDDAKVTVANGKVTAVAEGTATVTAKAGDKTATCAVTVKKDNRTPTYDEGVVINGVKWATRNVDKPGTFAAKPESAGMYYQWNKAVGWSANPLINSNGSSDWDSEKASGTVWEVSNNVCPAGWHIPDRKEIELLMDASSAMVTTPADGRIFGSGANTIFLPAAGDLHPLTGEFDNGYGVYWSSEAVSDGAYGFGFNSTGYGSDYDGRGNARSIRCVSNN